MSQRVMIAMAIACNPKLLIADEPTTALDVTIQAQILDLLLRLQRETGMALVLITHDMGVVAETAERVVVQYAGQQVETATRATCSSDPHHPYTAALLAALPERATGARAADDPRRRARPVRPAGGLPVLAALRAMPPSSAATVPPPPWRRRSSAMRCCHYPLVARRPADQTGSERRMSRRPRRPRPRRATTRSSRGLFAPPATREGARRRSASRSRPARPWPWSASPAAASRRWRASSR